MKSESISPELRKDGTPRTERKPYSYRPEMCEELVAWMSQGYSYTTFSASKGPSYVSVATMYQWEKDHPQWQQAKKDGFAAGQKFFEDLLLNASVGVIPDSLKKLKSKGINLSGVIFALKTRFHKDYSEKIEVDTTSSDGSQKVTFVMPETEDGKEYAVKKIVTT